MKRIGFIAAGFCIMAGLVGILGMIGNVIVILRIGDGFSIFWPIQSVIIGTAWIMLGVFIGMLAHKLK
ncbi:MAG: hypothetical protein ACJ0FR_03075 [Gammaproteobacteria bacterium]|nr:MAG: hypothetical protein CBD94_03455 [Gammaproteobacteria bacterium TMED234]|tara:strand:- start:176 stop:379 length:204 start_codon:yes stop_codon:yes gene_type:complete